MSGRPWWWNNHSATSTNRPVKRLQGDFFMKKTGKVFDIKILFVSLQPWTWQRNDTSRLGCYWQFMCQCCYCRRFMSMREVFLTTRWNAPTACTTAVMATSHRPLLGCTTACFASSWRSRCWQLLWWLSRYMFMYVRKTAPSFPSATSPPAGTTS